MLRTLLKDKLFWGIVATISLCATGIIIMVIGIMRTFGAS